MARTARVLSADELQTASRCAGYGLTNTAIAHILDIAPRTFERLLHDSPLVLAALEKGRADAEHMVSQALYTKALKGDLGAIVWWEKTRAGRHERQEIILTDEQREARIAELLQRGEARLKLA